jgi:hypothetical protein
MLRVMVHSVGPGRSVVNLLRGVMTECHQEAGQYCCSPVTISSDIESTVVSALTHPPQPATLYRYNLSLSPRLLLPPFLLTN